MLTQYNADVPGKVEWICRYVPHPFINSIVDDTRPTHHPNRNQCTNQWLQTVWLRGCATLKMCGKTNEHENNHDGKTSSGFDFTPAELWMGKMTLLFGGTRSLDGNESDQVKGKSGFVILTLKTALWGAYLLLALAVNCVCGWSEFMDYFFHVLISKIRVYLIARSENTQLFNKIKLRISWLA